MLWAEPKESPAETAVIVLTVSSKRFHVLSDKDISSVTRAALISLLTVKHKTCSCSPVSRWGTQRRFGLCAVVDAAGGAAGLKTARVFATTRFVYSLLSSPYSCPVIFPQCSLVSLFLPFRLGFLGFHFLSVVDH